MKKTATVFKIITITLNAFFLISSLAILAKIGPTSLHPALVIIPLLAPVICIASLAFSNKLLAGFMWFLSISAAIFTNAVLLGFVVYALASWGMPGLPGQNFLVPLWLLLPIISCITLFLVRSQIKKNGASDHSTVICPHCGGDVNV